MSEVNKFCDACGQALQEDASFCSSCGRNLEGAAEPLARPASTPASGQPQASTHVVHSRSGTSAGDGFGFGAGACMGCLLAGVIVVGIVALWWFR